MAAQKQKYHLRSTDNELEKQKAIMNKFMPVSYYEHHRLYIEGDVIKMMEQYKEHILQSAIPEEIKWTGIEYNQIEGVAEATC